MKISSRLISKRTRISDNIIKLDLDPDVGTIESYFPVFSLSAFFADLGGSLGLWLGLGAVQLLSSVAEFLLTMKSRRKNLKKFNNK